MSYFLNEDSTGNLVEVLTEEDEILLAIKNLEESTIVRINATSKREAAINRATIQIAREEGDPMYNKYIFAKKRFRMFRTRIRQKYYSRGRMRVDSMKQRY